MMALSNTYDIRLFEVDSGQMIGLPMYGHTNLVTSLAFTPDGACQPLEAPDGTVRIWDTSSGQQFGVSLRKRPNGQIPLTSVQMAIGWPLPGRTAPSGLM